jgi:histone H3/H4
MAESASSAAAELTMSLTTEEIAELQQLNDLMKPKRKRKRDDVVKDVAVQDASGASAKPKPKPKPKTYQQQCAIQKKLTSEAENGKPFLKAKQMWRVVRNQVALFIGDKTKVSKGAVNGIQLATEDLLRRLVCTAVMHMKSRATITADDLRTVILMHASMAPDTAWSAPSPSRSSGAVDVVKFSRPSMKKFINFNGRFRISGDVYDEMIEFINLFVSRIVHLACVYMLNAKNKAKILSAAHVNQALDIMGRKMYAVESEKKKKKTMKKTMKTDADDDDTKSDMESDSDNDNAESGTTESDTDTESDDDESDDDESDDDDSESDDDE